MEVPVDEDPQHTISYWKEKCRILELQLQEQHSIKDVETQCSVSENNHIDNTDKSNDTEIIQKLNNENEQLQIQIEWLQGEVEKFNLQASSILNPPVTKNEVRLT